MAQESPATLTQTWEKLFRESVSSILRFFETGEDDKKAIAKARIATSVLSSCTRHEATVSAREQTAVVIARQLASNKKEFREYLRMAEPQVKMLQ